MFISENRSFETKDEAVVYSQSIAFKHKTDALFSVLDTKSGERFYPKKDISLDAIFDHAMRSVKAYWDVEVVRDRLWQVVERPNLVVLKDGGGARYPDAFVTFWNDSVVLVDDIELVMLRRMNKVAYTINLRLERI